MRRGCSLRVPGNPMPPIEVLYQDASLVAVNKPPGVAVHEAPGPGRSLLRLLREQGLPDLLPAHRLDKDSSGVLLLARSKATARELRRNWQWVKKTYQVLVSGTPVRPSGCVDAPILEHQTGKPRRLELALDHYRKTHPEKELPAPPAPKTSAVHPAGRPARTEYRVLESFGRDRSAWAWLEVLPQHGRMHQIRVHLAHAGHPLAGDTLYGDRTALIAAEGLGLRRLALHTARLKFPHPAEPDRRLGPAAGRGSPPSGRPAHRPGNAAHVQDINGGTGAWPVGRGRACRERNARSWRARA